MIWIFDGIENKCDVYRGEDCMKKFWESLRERALKIINFEKKKMIQLQKNNRNRMKKQKSVTFPKKSSNISILIIKIIVKLNTIVIILVNSETLHIAHLIWNIVYLNKLLWLFTMNYYFIMKNLAKKFKGELTWLREITEK